MEITIRRRGGFAGLVETLGPIDTSRLSPEQGRAIELAVDAVKSTLASDAEPQDVGADLIEFDLDIAQAGEHESLHIVDEGGVLTSRLEQLLQQLRGAV